MGLKVSAFVRVHECSDITVDSELKKYLSFY